MAGARAPRARGPPRRLLLMRDTRITRAASHAATALPARHTFSPLGTHAFRRTLALAYLYSRFFCALPLDTLAFHLQHLSRPSLPRTAAVRCSNRLFLSASDLLPASALAARLNRRRTSTGRFARLFRQTNAHALNSATPNYLPLRLRFAPRIGLSPPTTGSCRCDTTSLHAQRAAPTYALPRAA